MNDSAADSTAFREYTWTSGDGLKLYARDYDRVGSVAPVVLCPDLRGRFFFGSGSGAIT